MRTKQKEYWKSLEELESSESNIEKLHEFPADLIEEKFEADKMPPVSRRKFMALLGASSAFAMASCTDYPDKGEIVTYNEKPEFSIMGEAVYYASSMNDGQSVLVKTREGRPIKIDGNPENPLSKGKITAQAQAEILNLYDPERLRAPVGLSESDLNLEKGREVEVEWAKVDTDVVAALKKAVASNKEIAIISHAIKSPTQFKLLQDFKAKYPTTKLYTYEFWDEKNRERAWEEICAKINKFNPDKGDENRIPPPIRQQLPKNLPTIRWEKANIILSLESDFLGNEGHVPEQVRAFASRRDVNNPEGFNRLYCVEGAMTQTGINADYRLRLDPVFQYNFILSLFVEVLNKIDADLAANFIISDKIKSLANYFPGDEKAKKILGSLLRDIIDNRGKALIYAGEKLPYEVHQLVHSLNLLLNEGEMFDFDECLVDYKSNFDNDIYTLTQTLKAGKVGVIINFDSNPLFHIPSTFKLIDDWNKAGTIISLVESRNESVINSKYVIPINHALESWGDYETRKGLLNLQQPVISPLYKTRQKESILLNWMSEKPESYSADNYHQYLMKRWEAEVYPEMKTVAGFRKFWLSTLHDGFIEYKIKTNTIEDKDTILVSLSDCLNEIKKEPEKKGFTLILSKNYTIGDGRYANNGWLQELPHPVSKVTWDNYAAIAPKTGKELGVKNNDVVEISVEDRKVKLPVLLQPGMAENVVAVELGYGRTVVGEVGLGVGTNANLLIPKDNSRIVGGVKVTKTNEVYKLASTQEHHSLDDESIKDFHFKRDIIQEGTLDEYLKNPKFLHDKHHPDIGMNPPIEYKGVKWAMAIDLNKCINCTNCVVSCNIENNIPVVGKDQVSRGREMHWIRLDRYYSGTSGDPRVSIQPMLCSHCDKAPCENVCPVVATNHSPDGLNQMVYNRCVGTRYCANNCPYKVRRFNFYNFRSEFANGFYEKDSIHLVHNPEVTVRSRGVMEKCTFCIQRIMDAKQEAKKDGRSLKGSYVTTACQQACPADAIVFGDMNDPGSEISKLREHNLSYHVLEMLNIKPNVTYIAKLKNKHTEDV